jgi:hypothetical protein
MKGYDGFSSKDTSAKAKKAATPHQRAPRPVPYPLFHLLLCLPPHDQAPSAIEATTGMPPHIPPKRPLVLVCDACRILHHGGYRRRGPCRYRRTPAVVNRSPSPNHDRCCPPGTTTSCRGNVRPAHPQTLMVTTTTGGTGCCTVEKTTNTQRTPSRRTRGGGDDHDHTTPPSFLQLNRSSS